MMGSLDQGDGEAEPLCLTSLPRELLSLVVCVAGAPSFTVVGGTCQALRDVAEVESEAHARALYSAETLEIGRKCYASWRLLVERHNAEGGVWVLPLCRICSWKHNGIYGGRYYKAWVPKLVLCELTHTVQIVVEALGERDLRPAHLTTLLRVTVAGGVRGQCLVTQIAPIQPTGHKYLKNGPGHKICVLDFPSSLLTSPVDASLHFVYAGDLGNSGLRGARSRRSRAKAQNGSLRARPTAGAWRRVRCRLATLPSRLPPAAPDQPHPCSAGTDYECTHLLKVSAGLDARATVLRASTTAPTGTAAQPSALQPPQSAAYFALRESACDIPDGAGPMHPSWALPPAVLERWRLGTWGCST